MFFWSQTNKRWWKKWKNLRSPTHISSKSDEVRSGEVYGEVVVQLLFKHNLTVLWKWERQQELSQTFYRYQTETRTTTNIFCLQPHFEERWNIVLRCKWKQSAGICKSQNPYLIHNRTEHIWNIQTKKLNHFYKNIHFLVWWQ